MRRILIVCICLQFFQTTHAQTDRVFIRCASSVFHAPLIVVDGEPFRGNLQTINPNEIDSIKVLKSAESIPIYGSQATHGVILIYTKKNISNTIRVLDNIDSSFIPNASLVMISFDQTDTISLVADENGEIVKPILRGKNYILKVSSVGYKTGGWMLIDAANNFPKELVLERNVVENQECIVTAYGVTRSSMLTCCGFYKCTKHIKKNEDDLTLSSMRPVIFPNPVRTGQVFSIRVGDWEAEKLICRISSATGSLVHQQEIKVAKAGQQFEISTDTRWKPGVYFVQLNSPNGPQLYSGKIIIQ